MPIAAVAAGFGRAGAAVSRGAVSVGTNIAKSTTNTVASQRSRLIQQQQRARIQAQKTQGQSNLGVSPSMNTRMPKARSLESANADKPGSTNNQQQIQQQEQNGMSMSRATTLRNAVFDQQNQQRQQSADEVRKPGEATKEELKKRDARENVIEAYLQSLNLGLTAIELATAGAGFLLTFVPRMLTLGRWNMQLIVGDIIGRGKNKYISGLKYRGGLSILKYLDPRAMGFTAFVIMIDVVFVLIGLLIFALMTLMVLAMLSPLLIGAYFFGELFGG